MLTGNTELIFPPYAIPEIVAECSGVWQALAQKADPAQEHSIEKTAFILMMARLNGCASCNADSFRALHGCMQCTRQTIRRFKGAETEVHAEYDKAVKEVSDYFSKSIHR